MNVGQKVLVIPDLHVPYHEERALELVFAVAKREKPDTVILLGDVLDFYGLSTFIKLASRDQFVIDEIEAARKVLTRFERAFPDCVRIYLEGNHEYRLTCFIADKCPQLFGLLTLQDLLQLRTRGWELVPYGEYIKIGKLHFSHEGGVRRGQDFARKIVASTNASFCIGHHHRIQSVEWRSMNDRHVCFSPGHLCDEKAVAEYIRAPVINWHMGFSLIQFLDNGQFFHQIHPIINYRALVNGRLYEI